MQDEFITAIKTHQRAFGLDLADESIGRLANYYEIVMEHNAILHLVAPTSAEEFATRHILESLTLLEYLPKSARFADIGAGAGLPSIPCLLVRDDLQAVLIESKIKKTKFLETAIERLEIIDRVQIVNRQFEEAEAGNFTFVTCRALDKFTDNLPKLLKWCGKRGLLFFGGKNLREALQQKNITFDEKLMPMSERRYLLRVTAT